MAAIGPELKPGDIVPGTKYRVIRSLGAGGMGVIFQVVKPPDIQGVLKLMSSELTAMEDLRIRFFDEVRILARLDHPNIVRVFDYDALPDGAPFYVMELLNGSTVRDVLDTVGKVPPRVAYEITRQLLEALQCAHTYEIPVIHRDIKPENIFLHSPRHGEPIVKLIDFGVSAVADRSHDGTFVGTWAYAAPEQIRGELPTPATDLYAAGLVLYEMLAGRGPFDHYTDWTQISQAQINEIPAPLSHFAPWVPASIVALVSSALAKDPKQRPRDAYAFSERLFELEWASDGKDPHDRTAEIKNRPLAKVLSTLGGRKPEEPAPPESVRSGPTWKGLPETPEPDTMELLDGLGATPAPPRSSDPAIASTPRPGQVVIKAGRNASGPQEDHGPTTPRAAPVAIGVGARDTFSSQAKDTKSKPAATKTWPFVALALMGVITIVTMFLLLRAGANRASNGGTTTAAGPGPAAVGSTTATAGSAPTPSGSVSATAASAAAAGGSAPPVGPSTAASASAGGARKPPAAPHPAASAQHPPTPAGRDDYMRGL